MTDQTYEKRQRFGFGMNWRSYLASLNDEKIRQAEKSLLDLYNLDTLENMSFLDVGCGSGLFSLAAMRLKASKVYSFDLDTDCVDCARQLKSRFFPNAPAWVIEKGNVLDPEYLNGLGQFDLVYAWGVVHYTGDMWRALDLITTVVAPGGTLFVAIFDDAGFLSTIATAIKKIYNKLPSFLKLPYIITLLPLIEGPPVIKNILAKQPPFSHWSQYYLKRGMSRWHDIKMMVGGYPYEFAAIDLIFDFFKSRNFTLQKLKCGRKGGNNQYVFKLDSSASTGDQGDGAK